MLLQSFCVSKLPMLPTPTISSSQLHTEIRLRLVRDEYKGRLYRHQVLWWILNTFLVHLDGVA